MSGDDCARWRSDAAFFALGDMDARRRSEFVAHLHTCPRCRHEVASMAEVLDALVGVAPPVVPSGDFVERTLGTLPLDPPKATEQGKIPARPWRHAPGRSPHGAPRTRRRVAALALAVFVVIACSALLIRTGHQSAAGVVAVTMKGPKGQPVGQAVLSSQRPASIAVNFDVPAGSQKGANGKYQVIALQRDNHPLLLGVVTVSAGHGGLQAETDVPTNDIVAVEVLRSDGTGLCSGALPPPPKGDRVPPPPGGGRPPPANRTTQPRATA